MDWIQGVFPVNAGIRSNNDEGITIPALVVFNLNDAPVDEANQLILHHNQLHSPQTSVS